MEDMQMLFFLYQKYPLSGVLKFYLQVDAASWQYSHNKAYLIWISFSLKSYILFLVFSLLLASCTSVIVVRGAGCRITTMALSGSFFIASTVVYCTVLRVQYFFSAQASAYERSTTGTKAFLSKSVLVRKTARLLAGSSTDVSIGQYSVVSYCFEVLNSFPFRYMLCTVLC